MDILFLAIPCFPYIKLMLKVHLQLKALVRPSCLVPASITFDENESNLSRYNSE